MLHLTVSEFLISSFLVNFFTVALKNVLTVQADRKIDGKLKLH